MCSLLQSAQENVPCVCDHISQSPFDCDVVSPVFKSISRSHPCPQTPGRLFEPCIQDHQLVFDAPLLPSVTLLISLSQPKRSKCVCSPTPSNFGVQVAHYNDYIMWFALQPCFHVICIEANYCFSIILAHWCVHLYDADLGQVRLQFDNQYSLWHSL